MPRKKGHEKDDLLKDRDIQRWYRNVARGAEITADTYYRRLRAFFKWADTTPQAILKLDEKAMFDLVLDFVTHEEERGMSGSYIDSSLKAIKSWLNFNGITINRKIKIRDAGKRTTLDEERVPTQEELRTIFLSSTKRDRVSCALMAHAGVRPETLGNYRGTDGLRIQDFPEMRVEDDTINFETIPTMIVVRSELSKAGHRYITFIGDEACGYLKDYLEQRIRDGETLEPGTDIIHPKISKKQFIRTINIGDGVRSSIRSAGFPWRPYVLRSYFNTMLQIAESKGKMTASYRKYFFGHSGDMEARYSTNKNVLTPALVEDMREAYQRSMEFLQTTPSGKDEKDTQAEFKLMMLRMAGLSEEEINKIDIGTISDEEVWEHLQKKLIPSGNRNAQVNNGNRQVVVPIVEAEDLIQQGFEYVRDFPGDKIILRNPF